MSQDQIEAIARRLARRFRISLQRARIIAELPLAHGKGSR